MQPLEMCISTLVVVLSPNSFCLMTCVCCIVSACSDMLVSFSPSHGTFVPSLVPVDRDGHGREGDGRARLARQARGLQ